MRTNPICRQIDWDSNPAYLEAWKSGQTGYPWIDAAMTQLRQEGWIHHLARCVFLLKPTYPRPSLSLS